MSNLDAQAHRELTQVQARAHRLREDGEERRPVVAVNLEDLMAAELPAREMLLAPWLESQSLAMIYAWRGVGKTHIALGIAYALATGGTFLNWTASQPVRVLYLDGEMPGVVLRERFAHLVNDGRMPAPGFLRVVTPDLQSEGVIPNLALPSGQAALDAVIGDAQVIIVDNLSCWVRGGKENEADSWNPVSEWALHMRANRRSVIFIHHAGKGGQQRGTSKREDLLDVVMLLKRPADYAADQGARFEIHFEKARSLHGQDVLPMEASLETDAGRQQWTTRSVEAIGESKMLELADMGLSQAEIARELEVHRSTVSRAFRKAEQEGRLTPPGSKNHRSSAGKRRPRSTEAPAASVTLSELDAAEHRGRSPPA
ncbi:AAA family ATPase [Lysobacter sp. CA199]|uniref:AAA family ATPase n=1 Tax=Lysobacter sp. CA199 TaxID=3455608 RepID=UPI003F8D78E4